MVYQQFIFLSFYIFTNLVGSSPPHPHAVCQYVLRYSSFLDLLSKIVFVLFFFTECTFGISTIS